MANSTLPVALSHLDLDFTDPVCQMLIAETSRIYGASISFSAAAMNVRKFGKNSNLGTSLSTVAAMEQDETYVSTNAIDKISSSDAADTMDVSIEGLTVTGSGEDQEFTRVTYTQTLAGQTETALSTPLARVQRVRIIGDTTNAGDIYVYQDDTVTAGVPQNAAKIHMKVPAGDGQSYKLAITLPNDEFGYLIGTELAILKKTAAQCDFIIERRLVGGIFQPQFRTGRSTTGTAAGYSQLPLPIIFPPNSDFRVRALASTTSVEVNGNAYFRIAKVMSAL